MNIAMERGRAASSNLSLVSLFWYSCCHSCNYKPVRLCVHVMIFYLHISCLLYKCIYFMCHVPKTITISHAREYSCFFFKTTHQLRYIVSILIRIYYCSFREGTSKSGKVDPHHLCYCILEINC